MEVCKPLKSDDKLKHRPLTPYRFLCGAMCLVTFLSTVFMLLAYLGAASVLLRHFSIHFSSSVLRDVPQQERVLIICNHRTEVYWIYLWDLAVRKRSLGCIKYILKSNLMKLHVHGWGFHVLEFIYVDRKWETDETIMHEMLSSFKDRRDPLSLALFPEGTDFTEEKCNKTRRYAAEVGLPVLTNVLLPKTRGFYLCLETLRGSFDAGPPSVHGYSARWSSFAT